MFRHLTILLLSSLALACAAPADLPLANSDKSDETSDAACLSDEPLLACIETQCPDLVDAEFDDCFTEHCEEGHDDTPLTCGLCIVDGFEAGLNAAEIGASCTASAPSETLTGVACAGDDLDLLSCIEDDCSDAETDDELGECIAASCSAQVDATAMSCLLCIETQHSQTSTPDGSEPEPTLEESCTSNTSAPCDIEAATAMQSCAVDTCAGAQGHALDECMDLECPAVFENVTEQCGQCIVALNQNGVPMGDAAANCAGH